MIRPGIFISHSHHDNVFCYRVRDFLLQHFADADIFFDLSELQGGDEWMRLIPEAVIARPIFIVILSPHSVIAPWVREETLMALREAVGNPQRRIIPLRYQPCDDKLLSPLLQNRQIIDLTGSASTRGWDDLLHSIESDKPLLAASTNAASLAMEQTLDYVAQAHEAFDQGHWPQVIRVALYAVAQPGNEQNAALWGELGTAYLKQGDMSEGTKALHQALQINPARSDIWRLVAWAESQQKHYHEAENAWSMALVNTTSPESRLEVLDEEITTFIASQQWPLALSASEEALLISPQDATWLGRKLAALEGVNRWQDAAAFAQSLLPSQSALITEWAENQYLRWLPSNSLSGNTAKVERKSRLLRVVNLGLAATHQGVLWVQSKLNVLDEDPELRSILEYIETIKADQPELILRWAEKRFAVAENKQDWLGADLVCDVALSISPEDEVWITRKLHMLATKDAFDAQLIFAHQIQDNHPSLVLQWTAPLFETLTQKSRFSEAGQIVAVSLRIDITSDKWQQNGTNLIQAQMQPIKSDEPESDAWQSILSLLQSWLLINQEWGLQLAETLYKETEQKKWWHLAQTLSEGILAIIPQSTIWKEHAEAAVSARLPVYQSSYYDDGYPENMWVSLPLAEELSVLYPTVVLAWLNKQFAGRQRIYSFNVAQNTYVAIDLGLSLDPANETWTQRKIATFKGSKVEIRSATLQFLPSIASHQPKFVLNWLESDYQERYPETNPYGYRSDYWDVQVRTHKEDIFQLINLALVAESHNATWLLRRYKALNVLEEYDEMNEIGQEFAHLYPQQAIEYAQEQYKPYFDESSYGWKDNVRKACDSIIRFIDLALLADPESSLWLTRKYRILQVSEHYEAAFAVAQQLTILPDADLDTWLLRMRAADAAKQWEDMQTSFAKAAQIVGPDDEKVKAARIEVYSLSKEAFPERLQMLGFIAKREKGVAFIIPPVAHIPAGAFTMGRNNRFLGEYVLEAERPAHEVFLPAFDMTKYPITLAEYLTAYRGRGVMDSIRTYNSSYQQLPFDVIASEVMFRSAIEYAIWLSERTGETWRLPTEAEWEKAARGTDQRIHPWGRGDGYDKRTGEKERIGFNTKGKSPYNVEDIIGHLEWTCTLYKPYPSAAEDGRDFINVFEEGIVMRGNSDAVHRYSAKDASTTACFRLVREVKS